MLDKTSSSWKGSETETDLANVTSALEETTKAAESIKQVLKAISQSTGSGAAVKNAKDGRTGVLVADAQFDDEAVFKSLVLSKGSFDNLTTSPVDNLVVTDALITDFGLAAALMGWGADFFKSDHGPIPPGAS